MMMMMMMMMMMIVGQSVESEVIGENLPHKSQMI
jgi:hypothetical protein